MKIAQITDFHFDDFLAQRFGLDTPSNFEVILNDIRASGCDLLILTGDFGVVERYPWMAERLHRDEYYFSLNLEGRRLIHLDSGHGEISPEQTDWLASELSSSGPAETIIFVHHPVLDCGTQMDVSMGLRGRERLETCLQTSGRDIVLFCGHYHFTHEIVKGRVRQFVTPACIMQIRSGNGQILSDSFDFGYRVIELSDNKLKTHTKMFVSPRKVMPGE